MGRVYNFSCVYANRSHSRPEKVIRYTKPLVGNIGTLSLWITIRGGLFFWVIDHDIAAVVSNSFHNHSFILFGTLASIAQIVATFFLVKVLKLRSFAIGTVFAKTEAVQTALMGVVFFGAMLPWIGWLAVTLGTVGILVISLPTHIEKVDPKSVKYGVLSGLAFAFTALWLRQASLSLEYSFIQNARLTLIYSITLQTLLCLLILLIKERTQFSLLLKTVPLSLFVGTTSALGSIGWYTAMTYQHAALVRSLGLLELVFAIAVSYLFFGEKVSARDIIGILAIAMSALVLIAFV